VIEPVAKFTENLKGTGGIRSIFNVGLEEWHPAQDVEYDLIWNQWCICHLTDQQLVQYLEKCKTVLRPGDGFITIKENLSIRGVDVFDDMDSTITRQVNLR
jgi:protein N-terminal methyltransferase